MMRRSFKRRGPWLGVVLAASLAASPALASGPHPASDSLGGYRTHSVGSVVAPNGDANPYGMAVVPLTSGKLVAGDLLVVDFNNKAGTAGGGTSILEVNPATGAKTTFASGLPVSGPVGIAINPVNDGVWVGDFGSGDGSSSNVLLISPAGSVLATFDSTTTSHPVSSGQQPTFNGVWGQGVSQMAGQVSFYYGTTGSGTTGTGGGEVWRIDPHPTGTANGQPVNSTYVEVATGLGDNATQGGKALPVTAANAAGPQGFAYDAATGVLYVSDDANNTIYALPGAATATGPVTPRVVLQGGALNVPENIVLDPATGQLLVANAGNNTLIAVNPQTGAVTGSRVLDTGASGALFGLAAVKTSGPRSAIFYDNDNTNTLNELVPPGSPTATTGAATHVTANGAQLNGVIDSSGTNTIWQFQYGRSTNYGRATPVRSIPAGQGVVRVSFKIGHLKPGTVIHFRLVAIPRGQSGSTSYGADRFFRTSTPGALRLTTRVLRVVHRHVLVPLTCASPLVCRGKFSITTRARVRRTRRFATLVCATTKRFYVIGAHRTRTISASVRPSCLALLNKSRSHRIRVKLTSNPRTGQRAVIKVLTMRLG